MVQPWLGHWCQLRYCHKSGGLLFRRVMYLEIAKLSFPKVVLPLDLYKALRLKKNHEDLVVCGILRYTQTDQFNLYSIDV